MKIFRYLMIYVGCLALLQSIACAKGMKTEALYPACKKGKCGFINSNGKFIIEPQWDNAYEFLEGLALIEKGERYGYVNRQGEIQIPLKYDRAAGFSEGFAKVTSESGNQFVNSSGKEFDVSHYESTGLWFSGNLLDFKLNGRCGYLDQSFKEVIPSKFKSCKPFQNDIARVKTIKGDWVTINKSGSVIYDYPVFYKDDNLMLIERNGKYQFMLGEIPLNDSLYEDALPFNQGFAIVQFDDYKYGVINREGELVIPGIYTEIMGPYDGWFAVQLGDLWGYVDTHNNVVFKYGPEQVYECDSQVCRVRVDEQDNLYGYISRETGEYIFNPKAH